MPIGSVAITALVFTANDTLMGVFAVAVLANTSDVIAVASGAVIIASGRHPSDTTAKGRQVTRNVCRETMEAQPPLDGEVIAPLDSDVERSMLALISINAIADMVIWIAPDGKYVFVNKAATRLLGYSAEEFSNLRVQEIDPYFDEDRWRNHWAEIEERGTVKIETTNIAKDGTEVIIEVTANFVLFNGKKYNFSIVRDITEKKITERKMLEDKEKIYKMSITDDLTGMANRRYFESKLEIEMGVCRISGSPLSIIIIDVDFFKRFNDRYGHLMGDECLRRVASAIMSAMRRPTDLAARYGGEEFVCVLSCTNADGAAIVAETIRQTITDLAIAHATSMVATVVTASLGVVTVSKIGDITRDQLLDEADALLYRAKRDGRNRVVRNPNFGGGT